MIFDGRSGYRQRGRVQPPLVWHEQQWAPRAESMPMTDAPYHHGNLRLALLDAAETLLLQQGADEVSTRAVAKVVGVSHNAPYRHFASREALLAGLAERGFERLASALNTSIAAIDEPGDRIMALGQAYVAFALEHRSVYSLMFSSNIDKHAHAGLEHAAKAAMAVLEEAMASLCKPADVALASRGAWALVHGVTSLMLEDKSGRLASLPSPLLDMALKTYVAGL